MIAPRTYAAGKYIDGFLNKIVSQQPHVLSSTEQLIDTLRNNTFPTNIILFTMDVENLYTSLPLQDCVSIVSTMLSKFPEPTRPDRELLQLLELSLYNNTFSFHNQHFRQIRGIAMDASYSSSVANLYMADWEDRFLSNHPKELLIWKRYIDDVFGIWQGGMKSLQCFISHLSTVDPSIRFTMQTSISSLQFLDLTIFKDERFLREGRLSYRIFFKPTSDLRLIDPKSFSPPSIKHSCIKGQIIRILRRCTYRSDAAQAINTLFHSLKLQGYGRSKLRQLKSYVFARVNLITISDEIQLGFTRCNNCFLCLHNSTTSGTTICVNNKLTYNMTHTTCYTCNIIYYIECTECKLFYVGETYRSLQMRVSEHISAIRLKYDTPIARHFKKHTDFWSCLKCGILAQNKYWITMARRDKESHFIAKLKTISPYGLNENKGHKTRRIVQPYVGIQLPTKRDEFIVYKQGRSLKRQFLINVKNKIK